MEFKQVQDGVAASWKRYGEKHNIPITEEFVILKLGEEYGEFIQAHVIQKKMCRKEKILPDDEARAEVAYELADIVGTAMLVAEKLGVDLEEELKKNYINLE